MSGDIVPVYIAPVTSLSKSRAPCTAPRIARAGKHPASFFVISCEDTHIHQLIIDTDMGLPSAASASAGMVQGTLLSPEDPKMSEHLAFLMGRSSKDARMYLRKWLREALRHAGIQPKTRSKVGAS